MIKVKFNGLPFTPKTFDDAIIEAVSEQLRAKLGSIRHPDTGEFPTIAITGTDLANLSVKVEGSPELMKLVEARLADEGTQPEGPGSLDTAAVQVGSPPKVFLSYAFDDAVLARRIAEALQGNGIDTFFADWSISSGDSIRQSIDEGLSDCTHFVVLLTPRSVVKPWVNQEMDAGLVRKLSAKSKFIALRSDLSTNDLPPLLQSMLSPSVENTNFDVSQLINDIHGITKKPPLGPAPKAVVQAQASPTGYSASATLLAKLFVESTEFARKFDPRHSIKELSSLLGLSEEDVKDAAHELHGLVTVHSESMVYPENELFVRFDRFWMPWDPAEDAVQLAKEMLSTESPSDSPADMANKLNWQPRRLNPALAYLANRKLVMSTSTISNGPWLLAFLRKTDETRRFLKSRQ